MYAFYKQEDYFNYQERKINNEAQEQIVAEESKTPEAIPISANISTLSFDDEEIRKYIQDTLSVE